MPRVAILIVTRDAASDLPDCLAALRAQRWRDFEILIVDNASRDGGPELARRLADGLPLRVLETGSNLGFGWR